jgi:hypothetical protein
MAASQHDDDRKRDDRTGDEDEQRERYRELLEELRTIMPGAQVLLGFLLTVPFASRFEELDSLGRAVFLGTLVCVASSTILFLAPAAHHRVAEGASRERRIRYGIRTEIAGMTLLALAVSGGLFVVVRFIYDSRAALVVAGGTLALNVVLWFLRPARDDPQTAER